MSFLSKGSEWNKWDFHVHTPFSYLNNGFGNNWDEYVKQLFKMAIQKNIKAIGITDYFTIDGYKKLKEEYLNDKVKLQTLFSDEEIAVIDSLLILPNIEFRLSQLVDGNRVNFHVIFSDNVSIQDIEENFLHELDFLYEGNLQDEDEKWKLKLNNLIQLGQKLKEEHTAFKNDSDIFVGMKCAVVDHSQITKVLNSKKSKFRDNYIIATPSDEDLSGLDWNGQGHNVRKVLIQKADVLFASNPNTRKWALGKFDGEEEYIKEFKSIKPVLWGSDAHDFDSLFESSNKRYCWIKAVRTFEGLRQVLYEPEDRVYIGESRPEEKTSYHTINHVRFIDSQFSPSTIPINSNLVTIIGGKSTGKSLLLRSIARTVDSNEVDKRLKECNILDYKKHIENFEVTWGDKQSQQYNLGEELPKKIIYIPQSYLNRLVDTPEDSSSIDEIITGVLKQEPEVDEVFNKIEQLQRENQKKISEEVNNVYYLIEDIKKQNAKIKEVGDEKGIQEEISKLGSEIKDLKEKSGLTDEEIQLYNSVVSQMSKNNDAIGVAKSNISKIQIATEQNLFVDISFDGLSESVKDSLNKSLDELKADFLKKWLEALNIQKVTQEEVVKKLSEENQKAQESIKALIEKVKSYNLLNEKIEKEKNENKKLKEILQQQEIKKGFVESLKSKLKDLKLLHQQYFEDLITSRDKILENHKIDSELEFDINVNFKSNLFQSNFVENILNQKQLSKYQDVSLSPYQYSSNANFENDVEKLVIALFTDKIVLKNNFTSKEAILKLLENWYIYDFQIKHNNDSISDMSPGKKSFVLLKLLIELDNSKCPILLDQPEDDLDNRSIYDDLVSFIRTKKKDRQIIIATHNPNLVVAADAEQVIVANQNGDKAPNRNYKFEYASGALENTFLDYSENIPTLEKQGIQEHVCDILEGGKLAFEKRKNKYNIK